MSDEFAIIGKPLPKVDAMGKVTGETVYADDLVLPRMLHCKILRSITPHARIIHVDTSQAEALPGVHAVITGKDLPIKFGILPVSQDEEALAVEKVRFVGDPVAAVAAVDEATAEAALDLIHVEYEQLPPLMSIQEALDEKETLIQEYGDDGNVHKVVALEFGDVEEGFAQADHIREDIFFYEGNTHLPMEQHAAVAHYAANGRLTLWSSTQTPHYVHRALAKTLELPQSRIRVVATPVGGGFGGKSDPFSHEVVVAKLSMLTGRPVKIALTREEVFYCHRGRHPVLMWVRTGVRKDGHITAMHFKSFLDGGGYGSYGVASTYYTGALQTITYQMDNYKFEGLRVFTNKPPCGPKRGHGTPQPRHALEIHVDKIAEDLGLDPVQMRLDNLLEDGARTVNHLTVTTTGLRECIEKVVDASGYRAKMGNLQPGKGIGLACGSYLTGAGLPIYWNKMPHSGVQLKIDRGGGVTIFCGSTDIGQGSDSVLAYVVAEALGVELADVAVVSADTDLTPVDLGSYSSRVTLMTGNAAIQAAGRLREMLDGVACEKLEIPHERLVAVGGRYYDVADPENGLPFPELVTLAEARYGTLGAVGSYTPPRRGGKFKGAGVGPSPAYTFSVAVIEVDCDAQTGQVKVEKIWLAHDVGRALNPLLVEGQIEGSVYMGLGEALMEEQVFRKGLHKIPSMLDYKSLTFLETPDIESIIVETNDPEGPFGAKEAGQGPLLPVMPAVAIAVHNALGVRIDETPITPEKIAKALEDKEKGGQGRVGPTAIPDYVFPEPIRVHPFSDPEEAEEITPRVAAGAD